MYRLRCVFGGEVGKYFGRYTTYVDCLDRAAVFKYEEGFQFIKNLYRGGVIFVPETISDTTVEDISEYEADFRFNILLAIIDYKINKDYSGPVLSATFCIRRELQFKPQAPLTCDSSFMLSSEFTWQNWQRFAHYYALGL